MLKLVYLIFCDLDGSKKLCSEVVVTSSDFYEVQRNKNCIEKQHLHGFSIQFLVPRNHSPARRQTGSDVGLQRNFKRQQVHNITINQLKTILISHETHTSQYQTFTQS